MTTAHLIHGYIGVGKTTLARRLEQQHNAIRFSPDQWMASLFGEDPPAETFQQHLTAILKMLEGQWVRCIELGVDVVLDYGFWLRSERDGVRATATEIGANVLLYRVNTSNAVARARVEERNARADRSLYIAPATFNLLKTRFEPLAPDESRIEA
jgi:predicted kinase